jgi:rhodanese-related sulfurtransferase
MRLINFVRIVIVALLLSGYSAWSLAQRQAREVPFLEGRSGSAIPLLRLAEAEDLWHQSTSVFVDVRSPTDYEFGHISGAILLPEEEIEQKLPELRPRLERAEVIVVYCKSVDCGKSLWAAIRLRNEGLKQTVIYPAGWNEWYLHELPTAGAGK